MKDSSFKLFLLNNYRSACDVYANLAMSWSEDRCPRGLNDVQFMYITVIYEFVQHGVKDSQMVSETQVINALFQEKSFVVFDLIAVEGGDRRIINSLGLTPKQYHLRISALRKSGLVEKINEKYFLTSFGKVVHEARQLIESAIKDYWKFKAIDAIWFELPKKERNKII